MCHTVAIYRSMNGYSGMRQGGSPAAHPPAGPGHHRRRPRHRALRHDEPGADLPVRPSPATCTSTAPPTSNSRHGEGHAQQPRVQQPEGVLQAAGHGRRRAELSLDREAGVPPARLLRRDRQRHVPHRHVDRSGPPSHASGRSPSCRWPVESTSPSPPCRLPVRPDHPAGRATTAGRIIFRNAGVEPEDIQLTGCYDAFTFTPGAAVRGLRLLQGRRGRRLRHQRHHRPRRRAPEQHQRRPSVRGLHARHEPGHRERPPAPPPGRRLVSRSADGTTPTTTARAAAARCTTSSWP